MPNDTQSPQQSRQSALEERFGKTVLKYGFTGVPNSFLMFEAQLHINSTQSRIINQLFSTWWESFPHPAIHTIAARLGKGDRCIQVNLRKLTYEVRDEDGKLIRPRLLEIRERRGVSEVSLPNDYDFTPLLLFLEQLVLAYEERKDRPEGRVNLSTPQGESSNGLRVNLSTSSEASSSSEQDSPKVGEGESFNGLRVNLSTPFEESNKEELLSSDSIDSKGIHFDLKTGNEEPSQNGHSKHPSPVEESAAAPPAWSDVPQPTEQAALPQEIICFVNDLSVEFGNRLRMKSNVSQARNLYTRVSRHLDHAGYQQMLYDCAVPVRAMPDSQVKTRNPDNSPNRMPYFFKRLKGRVESFSAGFAKEDAVIQQLNDQAAKSTAQSLMMRLLTSDELAAVNSLPDDEYWAQVARFMPGGDCYVE